MCLYIQGYFCEKFFSHDVCRVEIVYILPASSEWSGTKGLEVYRHRRGAILFAMYYFEAKMLYCGAFL